MKEKFDVLNEWGEFTGKIATREKCHKDGLWHRAVYAFIVNDKKEVLLQRRSSNKKQWPNKWDVTIGGHVLAGEFGREALIREAKEELDIDIDDNDIKYLIGSTFIKMSSINILMNVILSLRMWIYRKLNFRRKKFQRFDSLIFKKLWTWFMMIIKTLRKRLVPGIF